MRALILVLMLSAAARAAAQDLRPFCAERPGKATPPCILDAGHVQLEVGLADAVLQPHDNSYAFGAAELRRGLTRRAEAEVGWTPLITGHGSGVGDASLGLRWALTDPDRDGPALSAQVFATAPTATHGMGAGGWTGGARLPFAASLGAFDFDATAEGDVLRDADGRGVHAGGSLTVGLSHDVGPVTLGAELWGFLDRDPSGHVRQASFDLTAAHAIGKSAQIDAGVNIGLNHATPDAEIYAGVARRF